MTTWGLEKFALFDGSNAPGSSQGTGTDLPKPPAGLDQAKPTTNPYTAIAPHALPPAPAGLSRAQNIYKGTVNATGYVDMGQHALKLMASVPGLRNLPGASFLRSITPVASRVPTVGGFNPLSLSGGIAASTALDSAVGAGRAFAAGDGNWARGQSAIANEDLSPGSLPETGPEGSGRAHSLVMPGASNFSFNAPQLTTNLSRHLARDSRVDANWWRPVGTGLPATVDTPNAFDPSAARRSLNAGSPLDDFEYKVDPDGRHTLFYRPTQTSVPMNPEGFYGHVPPELRGRIEQALQAQRPEIYQSMADRAASLVGTAMRPASM